MFAKISPVAVFPHEAVQLRCLDVLIRGLGASAIPTATWALCDAQGVRLVQNFCDMPLEVYESWGPDDSEVLRWLAQKLSLTILEIDDEISDAVTPQPPPPPDPIFPVDPVDPVDPNNSVTP